MKTTKQLANEMADQVFQIRDACIEKKKNKQKRIMSIVKYAAPAAACCGLAVTLGISYGTKYARISEVEVTPSASYVTTAADNSRTTSTAAVTEKPVTVTTKAEKTVSKNDIHEDKGHDAEEKEALVSEEYSPADEDIQAPAVTEEPKSAETQAPVSTEPPVQTTAAVTTYDDSGDSGFIRYPGEFPRLRDTDDPTIVFPSIDIDGTELFAGPCCGSQILNHFPIPWQEDRELTAYDERRETNVTESVTIYGTKSRNDSQEYAIVKFNKYNIYVIYYVPAE